MSRNEFKRVNFQRYSDFLYKTDYLAWGNARGKNKIKKSLRRYSRRKLNQNLT